jgi:hypothetical protein
VRRLLVPLLVLLAAAAVGIAVGVVVLRRDDDGATREPTEQELALTRARVTVTGTMEPRTHLFGEPVIATIEALFDPSRVRAGTVRVEPGFRPYEVIEEERVESQAGDLTRVTHRYTLSCTRIGCTPNREKRQFEFPMTSVFFTIVGVGQAQDTVQWPPLEVVSRLGPFDLDEPRWRADTRHLPEATYRVAPLALAVGLFAAAAALVAAAIALVALVRPRPTAEEEEAVAAERRSPLERALELAELHSQDGSTPEQRKALERLARELGHVGHGELAGRARRLAWSPAAPDRADVHALASDVREATAREEDES